jgi:hypothetical protein
VKLPIVIVLCLVFAGIGFFGGRISGKPEDSGAASESGNPLAGGSSAKSRDDEDSGRGRNMSGSKSERRTASSAGPKKLVDSLNDLLATWNKPGIVLADGDEREVLHADLAELSELLAAINRADAADLVEIRELLLNTDDVTIEGEMLNSLLILPLTGRDIELRGAAVLDETVEKSAVEEDDTFSETLPMMLYTLARKNPAEAEAWLKTFEARPDVDDFTVDVDELKAMIEKGKAGR